MPRGNVIDPHKMDELHKKKLELGRLRKKASDLGVETNAEVPTSLEQADALIAQLREVIPTEKTDAQAKEKIQKVVASDSDELLKRIERLEAALTKAAVAPQTSPAGMTEEQFTRLLAKVNHGKTNEAGLFRSDWIDPEDRIEPETFFTPFEREFLTFVPNGGVNEEPPNNKPFLRFKNAFRWIQNTVNGPKIRTVATLTVASQKEKEWVMRHPKYGNSIFLDSESAVKFTDEDDYARLVRKHLNVLGHIADGKLAIMAHEMGIPVSARTTPDQYREAIAARRASTERQQKLSEEAAWKQARQADKMLLHGLGVASPVA